MAREAGGAVRNRKKRIKRILDIVGGKIYLTKRIFGYSYNERGFMDLEEIVQVETAQLQKAAEILKTVAHPVRLRIIDILEQGERSVNELSRLLNTAQPYTSQQLNLMKSKGILASRRDGNLMYYRVAHPSVVKVIHCVRQQ